MSNPDITLSIFKVVDTLASAGDYESIDYILSVFTNFVTTQEIVDLLTATLGMKAELKNREALYLYAVPLITHKFDEETAKKMLALLE
jgi:hypothetical protein